MVSGVSDAGLSTTVQPAASAGPILRVAMAAGKFHGVTSTATPAGLCCTRMRAPDGGRARDFADVAHGLFGVPAEELGRVGDLGARVGERLAVLERHQLGEAFGVADDQLERLAQHFGALARFLGGPAVHRGAGGVDRGLGVLDARAGDRGNRFLGRRVDDVKALVVGGFAPLAADVEIGRNVGEQIVVHGSVLLFPAHVRGLRTISDLILRSEAAGRASRMATVNALTFGHPSRRPRFARAPQDEV